MSEEKDRPDVKFCCKVCKVTRKDVDANRVVVSPAGGAHHAGSTYGGDTDCGHDATGDNWWWPL